MIVDKIAHLIKEILKSMIGRNGGIVLAGSGTTVSGEFIAIQSIGTTGKLGTVFGNISGLSSSEINPGTTIQGRFQSVTSGADATDIFICYRA